MAEIIDFCQRLRAAAPAPGDGVPAGVRIRIGGADGHWLGVVGGILAGALATQGTPAAFMDANGSTPAAPVMELVAGAGAPEVPSLLIGGSELPSPLLDGSDGQTILLCCEEPPVNFPGRTVPVSLNAPAPTPLVLAAACAGGAARLLGIGWNALEAALRRELTLAEPIETYLIAAFESYHRLAAWAGAAAPARSSSI